MQTLIQESGAGSQDPVLRQLVQNTLGVARFLKGCSFGQQHGEWMESAEIGRGEWDADAV